MSPIEPKCLNKKYILSKVFIFVQALICTSIGIHSLYILNGFGVLPQHTKTETILISLFLLCDLMRTTFIFIQSLIFRPHMIEILHILHNLESYFVRNLQHRICHKKFSESIRLKMTVIISVCCTYILSFLLRWFLRDDLNTAAFLFKLLQLMTAVSYVHAIFFIDLLSYYFVQFILVVHRDMMNWNGFTISCPVVKRNIRHRLKCYKFLHYRLWLANQRMNKYFGYSLIGILLHAFTDLIYVPVWTFQYIYAGVEILKIWSKSVLTIRYIYANLSSHFFDCRTDRLFCKQRLRLYCVSYCLHLFDKTGKLLRAIHRHWAQSCRRWAFASKIPWRWLKVCDAP